MQTIYHKVDEAEQENQSTNVLSLQASYAKKTAELKQVRRRKRLKLQQSVPERWNTVTLCRCVGRRRSAYIAIDEREDYDIANFIGTRVQIKV